MAFETCTFVPQEHRWKLFGNWSIIVNLQKINKILYTVGADYYYHCFMKTLDSKFMKTRKLSLKSNTEVESLGRCISVSKRSRFMT